MSEWVIEANDLTKVYKMGEVEVQALWHNALRLTAGWLAERGRDASGLVAAWKDDFVAWLDVHRPPGTPLSTGDSKATDKQIGKTASNPCRPNNTPSQS